MTPLVRRYIKTALIFFIFGVALGAHMSSVWGLMGRPIQYHLIVAHVHVLLVGFVIMLIMGVATWMFPRLPTGDTRYKPFLAETTYWIITLATILRASAEILLAYTDLPIMARLSAIGGLGQALAAILFVVNIWVRIRGVAATG